MSSPVVHQRTAHERPHPSPFAYVAIAVFLAVITSIEVAVYYIHELRPLLAPILLTLSATKFATVAAFYMHLRFDSKLFTYFFVGGLLLAGTLAISFMLLMSSGINGYISPPKVG
jgi:cytochrome c oxidase subunit 4